MDSITVLLQAASRAGVLTAALPDIVARGQSVFATTTPDALTVQQWVFGLTPVAPPLFGDGPPDAASVRARAAARLAQGPAGPAKTRGPAPVSLSAEHVAALAQLSPTARLTKYRE